MTEHLTFLPTETTALKLYLPSMHRAAACYTMQQPTGLCHLSVSSRNLQREIIYHFALTGEQLYKLGFRHNF